MKQALFDPGVPLAKDVSLKSANEGTLSIWDKSYRKISEKGAVRPGKRFALFISNNEINDIIKVVESLEKLDLLINGATETVKQEGRFIDDTYECLIGSTYASSLIQPVAFSLIKIL